MSTKVLYVLIGLACALALTAESARADDHERSRIVFSVQNVNDAAEACGGALFGLSFDMVSPAGVPLGSGRSCVHSFEGCSFAAGCHATLRATFTLDFARGSLTASMTLREVWPTETSFTQRGKGKVAAGTGEFSEARGRVKGGGAGAFTDLGLVADLVYVVHLTHDDD